MDGTKISGVLARLAGIVAGLFPKGSNGGGLPSGISRASAPDPFFFLDKRGFSAVFVGSAGSGKSVAASGCAVEAVRRGMGVCHVGFGEGRWADESALCHRAGARAFHLMDGGAERVGPGDARGLSEPVHCLVGHPMNRGASWWGPAQAGAPQPAPWCSQSEMIFDMMGANPGLRWLLIVDEIHGMTDWDGGFRDRWLRAAAMAARRGGGGVLTTMQQCMDESPPGGSDVFLFKHAIHYSATSGWEAWHGGLAREDFGVLPPGRAFARGDDGWMLVEFPYPRCEPPPAKGFPEWAARCEMESSELEAFLPGSARGAAGSPGL